MDVRDVDWRRSRGQLERIVALDIRMRGFTSRVSVHGNWWCRGTTGTITAGLCLHFISLRMSRRRPRRRSKVCVGIRGGSAGELRIRRVWGWSIIVSMIRALILRRRRIISCGTRWPRLGPPRPIIVMGGISVFRSKPRCADHRPEPCVTATTSTDGHAHGNQNPKTDDHEHQKYPTAPRAPSARVAFTIYIAGVIVGHG